MTRLYKEPKPAPTMGICGLIVLAGGLFFLLVSPGETTGAGEVINLHKAIIGQTLTICGTILCAVQWR